MRKCFPFLYKGNRNYSKSLLIKKTQKKGEKEGERRREREI
jgi:hypothetical protein